MSVSNMFQRLGAPLKNIRWSWGAVSKCGDVYLRVWEEDLTCLEGKRVVRVRLPRERQPDAFGKPGYKERVCHLKLIQSGSDSYGIVIRGRDAARIRDYISNKILIFGNLIEDDEGVYWLEVKGWKSVNLG